MSVPSPLQFETFARPGPEARPQLRWWWPGGAVELPVLLEQLEEFHAAGFGGVEIQPFTVGLPHHLSAEQQAAVEDYATPAFFAKVAVLARQAQALGMVVDVTFGSCWPFGGGEAVTPELAATELSLAWTSVEGGRRWQGRPRQPARPARSASYMEQIGALAPDRGLPPGWAERIAAREQVVAVLAVRGSEPSLGPFAGFVPMSLPDPWGQVLGAGWIDGSQTLDLTERLQPDGSLAWDAPAGTWQILVFKRFVIDQLLAESAGAGPQLLADHLNRAAFDAHAGRVGDAALPHWQALAGQGLRALFVDSLEIQADLHWCEDFEPEFERRRGYALRPWLPLLLQPGWRNPFQARRCAPLFDDAQAGERVRADYRRTVSELMLERLYAPFSDWAQRHGFQSRTQAHGAPVDWLQAYGLASMPETEDLMGGATAAFLRMARSAAHLYGRALVSSEAFVWLIEGLAVTPEKLRSRANELFAAGVQQIVGHGASYRCDLAGSGQPWYPWQQMEFGTQLDQASPLWPHLRPLTDYLARSQAALRMGQAEVPVAVLAPLDLFAFDGAGARINDPRWDAALQQAGYDWNWLNDEGLLACRWAAGALVTPGGHRYRALLLPERTLLRSDVARRLAELAEAGLPIVAIDAWPQRHEGWHLHAQRDAELHHALQQIVAAGNRCCPASQAGQVLRSRGLRPALQWRDDAGQGLRFVERREGARRLLFVHNPARQPVAATLVLDAPLRLSRWDAWQGEARALAGTQAGEQTLLDLQLQAGEAWLLLAEPGPVRVPPPAVLIDAPALELDGRWQLALDGRGLGGRVVALTRSLPCLRDLSLEEGLGDFGGEAAYELDFELAQDLAPGWVLDLGRLHDTAGVSIDGGAPTLACEGPFVFALPAGLAAGRHRLRVATRNVPENARRDPARPGGLPLPGRRLSRLPTGLIGPVRLRPAGAGELPRWTLNNKT